MAVLKLALSTARDDLTLEKEFETVGGNREIGNRLVNYVSSLITGTELAMSASIPPQIEISIQENETQATGSFAFAGVATADDTVLINGVTFTCVASGATGNQWDDGATAADSAENLAEAINRSVSNLVDGYVTAEAVGDDCIITSVFYGYAGNSITIAEGVDAGSDITASGARLTGGAPDATAQTLQF